MTGRVAVIEFPIRAWSILELSNRGGMFVMQFPQSGFDWRPVGGAG